MAAPVDAFLLPTSHAGGGGLMALWHPTESPPRGVVLYVHPFAEEMNKTRRMAALQARALAAEGYAVLQIDLLGCGDSSGDFADATWALWVADVLTAARWLRERSSAPLTLWGLRAGCLLLSEAAAQWPEACNFLFWQPTPSGAAVLRQFLRHAAAAALLDGGGKGVVEGLRQQLAAGEAIDVGGYGVHPALAAGLEQARLLPPPQVGQVVWLEVGSPAAEVAPASAAAGPQGVSAGAAPWRQRAAAFDAQVVPGPPFWQTSEIETAPNLLEATAAALSRRAPAAGKLVSSA